MHLSSAPCANTQYLNAYLHEQGAEYRRETWIEANAAERLAGIQPFSAADADEALCEVMNDAKSESRAAVLAALAGADDAVLGAAVRSAVTGYWMAFCRSKAEDAYAEGGAEQDADDARDEMIERRRMDAQDVRAEMSVEG